LNNCSAIATRSSTAEFSQTAQRVISASSDRNSSERVSFQGSAGKAKRSYRETLAWSSSDRQPGRLAYKGSLLVRRPYAEFVIVAHGVIVSASPTRSFPQGRRPAPLPCPPPLSPVAVGPSRVRSSWTALAGAPAGTHTAPSADTER
jgi:hypothetical protein